MIVISQRNRMIPLNYRDCLSHHINNQLFLCQCRLYIFTFKKVLKKRIHWRNYRYHPPFKELIISGMVLKHLYNFENKRSYNILRHFWTMPYLNDYWKSSKNRSTCHRKHLLLSSNFEVIYQGQWKITNIQNCRFCNFPAFCNFSCFLPWLSFHFKEIHFSPFQQQS